MRSVKKRIFQLRCLFMFMLFLGVCMQMQVYAQNTEGVGETTQMEEVNILKEKNGEARITLQVISTLDREEIAKLPVTNLQQLLEYIAGVDVRQRGADDVQADISIRGGSFDQTIILLNGINITDPQTGHLSLTIPINIENIDRIEVIQGSGDLPTTANALSGAINIVTGTAPKSNLKAQMAGGEYGYFAQQASADLLHKSYHGFAAIGNKKSDGYISNTDFDISNAFAQLRYNDTVLGNVNIQAGMIEKKYGSSGFYGSSKKQYETTKLFFSSMDYDKKMKNLTLNANINYRRVNDNYLWDYTNPGPKGYENHHLTEVISGGLFAGYLSNLGKTTIGGEVRTDHIFSNNLGDLMDVPKQIANEPDSIYYTKQKRRDIANYFIGHKYILNKLMASAKLQGSYSNDYGQFVTYNATVGYDIDTNLKLSLISNSAVRLPTFTDLYYYSDEQKGFIELKPEEAMNYEFDANYRKGIFNLQAAVFYRTIKNSIDWVLDPGAIKPVYTAKNIDTNIKGTNIFAVLLTKRELWFRQLRIDYTFLQSAIENNTENYLSRYTQDNLKHKLSVSAIHPLPMGFGLSWSGTYEIREANYPSVALANAKVYWDNNSLKIYADCSNIFNQNYEDFTGLPQIGRWIRVGLSYSL